MQYNDYKQAFLNSLPNYLGYNKLLSQQNKDQGDGLQRVGTMFTLLHLIGDQELIQQVAAIHPTYDKSLSLLMPKTGWYVRSSDPKSGWQNDMRQTSRDQLSIAKTAMAACHDTYRLKQVLLAQTLRFGFHQNYWSGTKYQIPDIMAPSEPSVYMRGLFGKLSSCFNWIFDLFFLTDIATRKINVLNIWSEDNLLATNLLFACHKYPSIIAKLLMKLYKKTDFMDRIKAYHFDDSNGCIPLYWLYKAAYARLENYP